MITGTCFLTKSVTSHKLAGSGYSLSNVVVKYINYNKDHLQKLYLICAYKKKDIYMLI